jgi:hypothetical protein
MNPIREIGTQFEQSKDLTRIQRIFQSILIGRTKPWAEINQALLSQFSHLTEIFIEKVSVKVSSSTAREISIQGKRDGTFYALVTHCCLGCFVTVEKKLIEPTANYTAG